MDGTSHPSPTRTSFPATSSDLVDLAEQRQQDAVSAMPASSSSTTLYAEHEVQERVTEGRAPLPNEDLAAALIANGSVVNELWSEGQRIRVPGRGSPR